MSKSSRRPKVRPADPEEYDNYASDYAEYDDYDEYNTVDDEPYPQQGILNSPGRRMAVLGSLFLLLLLVGALIMLLSTRKPEIAVPIAEAPTTGARAPGFDLIDVRTNQPVSLASLRGKPVLVNFWGTWCPPCREEMPVMEEVYKRYRDQVEFVGVSMGPRDSISGVNSFVTSMGYSWMFLQDDTGAIGTRYQAYQIPTSFFIDPNGVIKAVHIGPMNTVQLENYIKQAQ